MKEWHDYVIQSSNPNVLIMLSGGKDSIAALIKLVKKNINVVAIHFVHKWGETIPTEEAERICEIYDVKLVKYDFSYEFEKAIHGYTDGRPCLLCKKQMYSCLEQYLNKNNFGWIAIGDNANDKTTIARMKKYPNPFGDDNYICSDYFGTEMGCKLPDSMHVLRPLINMSAIEIEQFLSIEKIDVRRINSTGDKYFEYHREGCPVQFVDNGYPIDKILLKRLQEYNCKITEFARKKGIRASIHMPSTFIVTIPAGYEKEAMDYMENAGMKIDHDVNSKMLNFSRKYNAYIELAGTDILLHRTYLKLFERLLERIEMNDISFEISEGEREVVCFARDKAFRIVMVLDKIDMCVELNINFLRSERIDNKKIENLIIEIFRTRKYKIYGYSD